MRLLRKSAGSFPLRLSALALPALVFTLISACGGGGGGSAAAPPPPAPPPPPPPPPAAPFANATQASNIAFAYGITTPPGAGQQREVPLSTRGGAAAGDCDGDGDIDLFITYGDDDNGTGPGGPNRLYLNQTAQGNPLSFVDGAAAAGVANTRPGGLGNDRHSGPTFADMDGDGDLDLFLGGLFGDPNKIFENDGNCVFADVTASSPGIEALSLRGIVGDPTLRLHTISAAFGDYDLDGDLDMFLTHWGTRDDIYGGSHTRDTETDHLWRNDTPEGGTIAFTNVSEASGISDIAFQTRDYPSSTQAIDFTFTPTFAHLDGDLWPDIAIAGDFGTSQIAINDRDGTFTNSTNTDLGQAQYGMGSALGDYDNDGDLDWFVTSIFGPTDDPLTTLLGNRFFINDGTALFTDDTTRLGVAQGGWGWGTCFLDIDNDTDLDIFHTNGWPDAFLGAEAGFYSDDNSRAFVMNNVTRTYSNAAPVLGLDDDASGRGVVCADFDNDGDTDILELTDAPGNSARLWENNTAASGNNFLRIRLEGLPPNTEAAGARIVVTIGATEFMREITIGSNFTSQNPTLQIFGLGSATAVDEIRVEWPAVDSGGGPIQPAPTVLDASDPQGRVNASTPGTTHVIRHPDLP